MEDFFKLKKIDSDLQSVINPVTFFDVNPSNLESEKEKVLKDCDYNPQFEYGEAGYDFDEIQYKLHSVDEHDSPFGKLINLKRNTYIDKCEMLQSRGTRKFSVFCKKIYGMPSREVLDRSVSLLSLESKEEPKIVNSKQARHTIQAEINHYKFGYSVLTKQMSASAMVLVAKKIMFIKDNFSFSNNYVKRLLIHEIGTHVLRAENGRAQPFMMFFHGFPNYLSTEEGLAVVNEERFGLLNNVTLKDYAARAIAVQMTVNKSFSQIYNYFLDYFPPTTAFRIAARVKRGISDSSRPGGCTKDHVYIDGYIKVKKYLENEGNLDSLYAGKIGLDDLSRLPDIPGLSKPRYLPKNQSFKSLLDF
jgi:uncharacterized protein (TIGR02421 family)